MSKITQIRGMIVALPSMGLGEMSIHNELPQLLPYHLQDLFFIGGILLGIALVIRDVFNELEHTDINTTMEI